MIDLLESIPTVRNKKADVEEYPRVLDHIGLLIAKPPG